MNNSKNLQNELKELLTCPLTLDIFVDPVICEDGITYEREFIVKHILNKADNNEIAKSPYSRKPISLSGIRPNFIIKNLISIYNKNIGKKNNKIIKNDIIKNDWFDIKLKKKFDDPKFGICSNERIILFCYLIDLQYDNGSKLFSDKILMSSYMLIDKIFSLLLLNNNEDNNRKYLNIKWYQLIGIISLRLSFYFLEKVNPSEIGLSIDNCLELTFNIYTISEIISLQNYIMNLLDNKFDNNFITSIFNKINNMSKNILKLYNKSNKIINKNNFYDLLLSYIFRILIFDYKFLSHDIDLIVNVSCFLALKSYDKKIKWNIKLDKKINFENLIKYSNEISENINLQITILGIYKNNTDYSKCIQTLTKKFNIKNLDFYELNINRNRKRKISEL